MEAGHHKLNINLPFVMSLAQIDVVSASGILATATTPDALKYLESANDLPTALRLYAFALPRREAVWWAAMCAAGTCLAARPPAEREAREAAEHWVRRQDEPARRAAMAAARVAGFRAPEAWAAIAAFWSEGSMAPEGQPILPPAPDLTGKAVHGAISLAAVRARPQLRDDRLRRFLASAKDIAAGGGGPVDPDPP
jgi:hypothetical protein